MRIYEKAFRGEKPENFTWKLFSFAGVKMSENYAKLLTTNLFTEALTFQPEFAEPIVNISVAIGRDATFTCHVRHLGGYRVN